MLEDQISLDVRSDVQVVPEAGKEGLPRLALGQDRTRLWICLTEGTKGSRIPGRHNRYVGLDVAGRNACRRSDGFPLTKRTSHQEAGRELGRTDRCRHALR